MPEVVVTGFKVAAIPPEDEDAEGEGLAVEGAQAAENFVERAEELLEERFNPQRKGRPSNNQAQNKQIRDAARQAGLNAKQQQELANEVETDSRYYGANYGYQDILNLAREIKSGNH